MQRLPRRGRRRPRAARLRQRRVRQAARRSSTTSTSTRSWSRICTGTTSSTSCRTRPALTYAPRHQPVPVDGWPGTDDPPRPRLIAPPGARATFRQLCAARRDARGADRGRLPARGVRRRRRGRVGAAEGPLPAGAALPADPRGRGDRRGGPDHLQRRLVAERRPVRVRARHRPAADRGHAAAARARGAARAPDARGGGRARPPRGRSPARAHPHLRRAGRRVGARARPRGASAARSRWPTREPSTRSDALERGAVRADEGSGG